MAATSTREALLEQGALLLARERVAPVTARQLHEAVGARNESALNYHFGGKGGLVAEIVRVHMEAIEARRAALVAEIVATDRSDDVRSLVHALAAPMAVDLEDPLGRAHLQIIEQVSHPSLAYVKPFQVLDLPAGRAVSRWLWQALGEQPKPVRTERLAALRTQLISLFGQRAQLLDEEPDIATSGNELFLENLLDMLVAGIQAEASRSTIAASRRRPKRRS